MAAIAQGPDIDYEQLKFLDAKFHLTIVEIAKNRWKLQLFPRVPGETEFVPLPEANPALYLTPSLAITFPFNIAFGIPIYFAAARWLYS